MLLVALLIAAAAANLAARRPGRGARLEAIMGRMGLLDADNLAARSYRELWTGNAVGQMDAVSDAQRALMSDMASAYRWCDLGEELLEAGSEEKAKFCLRRAVELGPKAPHILMRAANAYFRLDDSRSALDCTRQILAIVSVYDEIIFSTYTRMGVTIDDVLAHGLPDSDVRAAQSFLRYVFAQRSLDDARKVWLWAGQRGALNDQVADRYAATLIQARQYETAIGLWSSYLGPRADRAANGWVLNGSFEHDPFGETFDWRVEQLPGVRVERDPKVAYAGKAALRLQFDGSDNVAYRHVRQTVVMPPGAYRFEAHMRTEDITTDQGIALRIHDATYEDRLRAQTANLVGSKAWTAISQEIIIPPPTRLMTIEVVRDPSQKFDSAIRGTAWVDDVRITRRQR